MHFSRADLDRVRIRNTPHALWEVLLSLHLLQAGDRKSPDREWLLQSSKRHGQPTEPLLELASPWGYSPDFLTPPLTGWGIDDAIDTLRSVSPGRLHHDISELALSRPLSPSSLAIGDGDSHALRRLSAAIARYYSAGIGAHWHRIVRAVDNDARRRRQILDQGGINRLLATLHPTIEWRRPVLFVDYPIDQDLHLLGRGLELIPSYFCTRKPITLKDSSLQPMLAFPASRPPGTSDHETARFDEALAPLLGRTRAAILGALVTGCTTTELAAGFGISLASASEHVTVLRNAGLATTQRYGTSRFHSLTELGESLLGHRVGL
ncbi:ArsR/SmtB family transcription factor [Micromonospora sp. NPDC000663]|uniref:ArsR/SmtB family transcription factor n=1 Tax=Micromonospora sp. NPDC000663 TaxID=3364218 RepID=UPI0036CC6CEB